MSAHRLLRKSYAVEANAHVKAEWWAVGPTIKESLIVRTEGRREVRRRFLRRLINRKS